MWIDGAGSLNESVTEYEHDCDGRLMTVWDPNHPLLGGTPSQEYFYDDLDRLLQVELPGLVLTTYEYDDQDHLTKVIDAEGNETTYVYSDRDLLTEEVSPVSGVTTHVYNEHGELTESTDARGVVTTRIVDELDRVTQISYSGDPTATRTFGYGSTAGFTLGMQVSGTSDAGTVGFDYDGFGRMVIDGDLGYQYDKNSNRTTLSYPGNVGASYGFDFADREQTLSLSVLGQPATATVLGASYLPSGPLDQIVLGNGLTEFHDFDERYYPDRITLENSVPTALFDWDYTPDAVGNVTNIADAILGSRSGMGEPPRL